MAKNLTRAQQRRKQRERQRRRQTMRDAAPIALLVVAAMAGATYLVVDAFDRAPQASCVLLIDRTSSSGERETTERYESQADAVVEGCADLDAELAVYYFNQEQAKIVEAAGNINLRDRSGFAEAEDAVREVFERRTGTAYASDILVPLDQAADELQSMRARVDVDSAHLIVLTDGLHLGSDVSVEQLAENPSSVGPLLDRAEALGLIPNLDGVAIDIVGVRTGLSPDGQAVADWFEPNLELFWRGLIERSEGRLCRYGTAPSQLPSRC